jgi:hypothetical protein
VVRKRQHELERFWNGEKNRLKEERQENERGEERERLESENVKNQERKEREESVEKRVDNIILINNNLNN